MARPPDGLDVQIVGMVLAVAMAPGDQFADPADEMDAVAERFRLVGFDVQAVSLHIDGMWRVEVLAG